DVHTATETADGSNLLPTAFVRTLPGEAGYPGSAVAACAQAEWGPPLTATTTAFTISACEWDAATSLGTLLAPPPPYPPNPSPMPSLDQVLKLRTTASGGCPTEPAGADGPGVFAWTDDPTGTCTADIDSSTYGADTGGAAGQSCTQALASAVASRIPVDIPVYASVTGTGSDAVYTLKGFAALVITGYQLPGAAAPDRLSHARQRAMPEKRNREASGTDRRAGDSARRARHRRGAGLRPPGQHPRPYRTESGQRAGGGERDSLRYLRGRCAARWPAQQPGAACSLGALRRDAFDHSQPERQGAER